MSATARLVEQNVLNEAAQGINGSVPLKKSPHSASSPKPQGKYSQVFLLRKLFSQTSESNRVYLERTVFEKEKTMGHKLSTEIQIFCKCPMIL